MSLVENLQVWKEAVQYYNEGDFQGALKKFKDMNDSSAKIMFNIGRVYLSLCELQKAFQAFQLVVKKDEHLAVGHFMLGVVNLMCTRHADALINFDESFRNLRGSKFIDYKQLGMRYKLFKCEVLLNRAVCLSSLGYFDSAVEDLLAALQCKVEPRHNIIDISLNNLQRGESIEFLVMDAIFQPPKSKTANLEKRDYLGKAQVVIDTDAYEMMETPARLRGRLKTNPTSGSGELYRVLYDFVAQSSFEVSVKAGDIITVSEKADDGWFTMVTNDARKTGLVPGSYLEKIEDGETKNSNQTLTTRQALLADLRKDESRQSLRRVKPPPNKQLPQLPSGVKFGKSDQNKRRTEELSTSARPVTHAFNGGGNSSPKVPKSKHRMLSEAKNPAVPPKFRRNSVENLLGKSPHDSPTLAKKSPELPQAIGESDGDDDVYEEIPDIEVAPYAVNDVVPPTAQNPATGKNYRKSPERPSPPPKLVTMLKPRGPPPGVAPRAPRTNTVAIHGSAFDQKLASMGVSPIAKPVRAPLRPPPSTVSPKPVRNKTNGPAKQAQGQVVAVEFIVSTPIKLSPSTTSNEIQNAVKEAISRNISSSLWCEKNGKRIRVDDYRTSNILDLVKDGKLKVWCSP